MVLTRRVGCGWKAAANGSGFGAGVSKICSNNRELLVMATRNPASKTRLLDVYIKPSKTNGINKLPTAT